VDEQFIGKLLTGGGLGTALVWLLYTVGQRIVKALDGVRDAMREHTDDVLASHARMHETLAHMRGSLGIPTPPMGVPVADARSRTERAPGPPETPPERPWARRREGR
jgi:hypothetical protein